MNIRQLCNMLELDSDFTDEILKYNQTVKTLRQFVGEDARGIKILTLYLHCLFKTYELYMEKGISETIFRDTVRFITRFVNKLFRFKPAIAQI